MNKAGFLREKKTLPEFSPQADESRSFRFRFDGVWGTMNDRHLILISNEKALLKMSRFLRKEMDGTMDASIKEERLEIDGIPVLIRGETAEKAFVMIHGRGGCKEECRDFSELAASRGWQTAALHLPGHGERRGERDGLVPWKAVPELERVTRWARCRWASVAVRAVSIGAWFAMLACADEKLSGALFDSPLLDMAGLIRRMMQRAGVSEERLRREKIIRTATGEELSWLYYEYARQHPARVWRQPCEILLAGRDELTDRGAVEKFATASGGRVTVMETGEHWFHTPEQTAFMHRWEERALARLEVLS